MILSLCGFVVFTTGLRALASAVLHKRTSYSVRLKDF